MPNRRPFWSGRGHPPDLRPVAPSTLEDCVRKHVSRFAAIAAVAMLVAALTPAIAVGKSQQAAAAQYTAGRYLVTFADAPVAEYSGYVKGFPASRAAAGKKLNAHSAAAQKWQKHLTSTHDAALAKVGATKIYDYTITNNGVATRLQREPGPEAVAAAGCRPPREGPARTARHDRVAALPRPRRGGRHLVAARRRPARRRRPRRRRDRQRHLAREPVVRGRHRHPDPGRPGTAPAGRPELPGTRPATTRSSAPATTYAGFGRKNIAKADYTVAA